jgi:hypothetical protein
MMALNVYQRINEIRKKCPYIKKDAKISGGGNYKAVTHDNVTSVVRPFFVEFGVVIVPRQVRGELKDTGKTTSSGTPFTVYDALYEIDFVNIDEPTDKITIPVGSLAEDTSDKGPGKSISYATKYAVLKLLMIETGESDESRNPDQTPEYISGSDLTMIKTLLNETSSDEKSFLNVAGAANFETIPLGKKSMLVGLLNKKLDKMVSAQCEPGAEG